MSIFTFGPMMFSSEPKGSRSSIVSSPFWKFRSPILKKKLYLTRANDSMQGAAVAYVANLLAIPVMSLKAVTDIVDGTKPTVDEFLLNMATAAAALARTVPRVIQYVSGKTLSDL